MEKYKFIDNITSDVVFEAYGETLNELFANAAEAMFTMICKIEHIEPKEERKIEAEADSVEDLLVNWLQSLIAAVDIEEMFFSKFKITDISDNKVTGYAYGQSVTPELGETVVKAVTYHQYEFKETDKGFMCRVSLDI